MIPFLIQVELDRLIEGDYVIEGKLQAARMCDPQNILAHQFDRIGFELRNRFAFLVDQAWVFIGFG